MSDPNWFTGGLITNVISTPLTLFVAWLISLVNTYLSRHTKVGIPVKLLIVALFLLAGQCIAVWLSSGILVLVVAVASIVLGWWALRGLFRVGLIDAFSRTSSGIEPAASLKLAHESIEFLGIGANKLTTDPEFEAAIRRCSSGGNGQTCRFLLTPPSNNFLETLALRNGGNATAYKDKVTESLKIFANLKINKKLSLDVRFYKSGEGSEFQQFRLMILNDDLCLTSWTVWDDKLGMNNPQIILRRASKVADQKATLFKAFKEHFEVMWQEGEVVDLKEYL